MTDRDTPAIRARHRRDARLIERILADPFLPTITRGRKAYCVRWAGGRATCCLRSKAALKQWFKDADTSAELVSVTHEDADQWSLSGKRSLLAPPRTIYTLKMLGVEHD